MLVSCNAGETAVSAGVDLPNNAANGNPFAYSWPETDLTGWRISLFGNGDANLHVVCCQ